MNFVGLTAVAGALILFGLLAAARKHSWQRPSDPALRSLEQSAPPPLASAPALRAHRTRRIVAIIFTILLLLAVGAVMVYVAFLDYTITANVKHEALLPTPSADEAPSAGDSSGNASTPKSASVKGALNILLVGADGVNGVADGRSDAIILVHISSDRKKVHLVHFPRDMYVEVPGYGKERINAAYMRGGSQLLIRTLQKLVDVPIDHVAVMERRGFILMTDAVGGVDVYSEEASTEFEMTIHVGMNHLNGDEAEAFVIERHELSMGDVSRGRREQAFIKALMLKILSKETLANPARFAALVTAISRNLTIDSGFSVADIYSEALALKNLRSNDFVFITAPVSGSSTTSTGAWVFTVDEARMAQLSNALRTDEMGSYTLGQ